MSIRQGSTIIAGSSGSGGTSNYNDLKNKPSINGITLEGNKTTEDLNINSLPDQTGNEGKVLITNGTEASWQTLPETGLPLFAHIWSDHLLTNSSYLRADTFSWQDGNIYYTAYNELVNEKNLTTETSTDTINNITITYYRTPKGYKIVLPDMADTIAQLYESTGTAWYYILDTDNTRFKLPRNSRYESGTTTENAGDFGAESLPKPFDIGGGLWINNAGNGIATMQVGNDNKVVIYSSSIYQDGAKVNPDRVTQFLYFYVGNTIQNETTINIAEITEALNNKADRDFSNITDGTYDFLTTKQVSNCITKIPQDIKLELNNGTLTLKAGSKVYDGAGAAVIVSQDSAIQGWGTNEQVAVFFSKSSNILSAMSLNRCFSGSIAPSSPADNSYWYDTSNKVIKQYSSSTSSWKNTTLTLPIAIVTMTGNENNVTSIDQVFNGFGYIGSTIFALPGIEGLIPNGRNIDGSLNNTKVATNSVSILTTSSTGNYMLAIRDTGEIDNWSIARYDEDKNIVYRTDSNQQVMLCVCGHLSRATSRVTSFSPKTAFQSVDRSDTEWASTASKPSNRYVDLTLQASGTTYTAPANGWFSLWQKDGTSSTGQITIRNLVSLFGIGSEGTVAGYTNLNLPVHKNEQVAVYYRNVTNTDFQFRFIYDGGVA